MARLIRTEKEVEGRFEEVWIVVEEDPLEQWPAGPLAVVGRPAPRKDGHERVRGEARYTADLKLPGMLHAAVLRSPHAHAKVRRIDLAPALALPGVRAAIGPGEAPGLEEEAGFSGAAVAAVAADTFRQARAAVEAIEIEWEELEVVLDPDDAVRRGLLTDEEPRRRERGDVERALAEADVVVEAEYRTQTVLHNSLETHQALCEWQGDTLHVYISTQFIWGIRQAVAGKLGLPEDKVRVVCEYMGGGFGSKNGPDEYTFVAAELAKRTGRPVRCALTRREEHTSAGNRNATIQRLRAGARSDGTIVAFDGEFTNSVGWSGWNAGTEGPMQMLYDCENVRTVTLRRAAQHAADEGIPRAGVRRGDVRARVPGRRARRPARHRPARAAAPQLRELERRHAVLLQEPRGVLPDARSRTGSGGTRCARDPMPSGSAAWGWRARSGTAAAGLLPTRGCDSARTAARR